MMEAFSLSVSHQRPDRVHLALQTANFSLCVGVSAGAFASINLVAALPHAQGLRADIEQTAHVTTRRHQRLVLRFRLDEHPECTLPELWVLFARHGLPILV